jgi:peptide/nickel transport system substrate-binding protein
MRTMTKICAAAAVIACVAGCGTSSGGGSGSTAGSGGAGKPSRGGNLTIARAEDSVTMNNTQAFDNESIWVLEQIFQPLYTVSPNGKGVIPWLATGYTMSSDKKTYTFTLRKGVDFSNGNPVTSADVKFSIDKARAAAAGWSFIDTAIASVAAPSPSTVVIHLKYPWAPLISDLSLFANAIVPANYGGQTAAQFFAHPVGTGPFEWGYWHRGQALKLVRNPHYWQPGLPYLNSVTWNVVPDDNTRQLQLQGGQTLIDEFPAWSTIASLKGQSGVVVDLFPSTRIDYLIMNEKSKPFQDVHVRRAISLAVNRAALVKAVLFGNGTPANSFLPPTLAYYDKATQGGQYNLAAAKQQLAESSVPHGFSFTYLVASGDSDQSVIAQALQAELKPLGITMKIQELDSAAENEDEAKLTYQMTWTYWTNDIPDPDELVTYAVNPKSSGESFYTDYDNARVISEAGQAERTFAPAARARLYNEIQTTVASDASLIPLYYSPYAYAMSTKVHGFYATPLGNFHLQDVWLSKS